MVHASKEVHCLNIDQLFILLYSCVAYTLDQKLTSSFCFTEAWKENSGHQEQTHYNSSHQFPDNNHIVLMESEYSDLNIEENLNALAALTDLLSSGSSIRMKDSVKVTADYDSSIQLRGSGAKIKRSVVKKHVPFWNQFGQMQHVKERHLNSHPCPVDSSSLMSKLHSHEPSFEKGKGSTDSHPIQLVYLGSDRRYNRYWL